MRPRRRAAWVVSIGLLAAALAVLASCTPRRESPPLQEGLRVSPQGVPATVGSAPLYDAASGVLGLPGLALADGDATTCFDAVLVTRSTAPLQLELASAAGRSCAGAPAHAGRYEAAAGLLTLPALRVQRGGDGACYDVRLRRVGGDPIRVELVAAVDAACFDAAAPPPAAGSFRGNLVLGSPTDRSIKANVFVPDQAGHVWLAYGLAPGVYSHRTDPQALGAGRPLEIALDGLLADARYHYRLFFQPDGSAAAGAADEASFHTARPPGSRFVFALQGDSHPERLRSQFDPDLYRRTLQTAAADRPDFYLLLGDDFSVDTLDPKTIDAAKVTERYTLQRPYLGLIGRSAPLFLVNGNHEQAARYLLDGTPDNVAVWAQKARNAHYSQPAPDAFYSGNEEVVPHIGLLRNHFAWTWGDALFVVIDPYWSSPVVVDAPFGGGDKRSNLWDVTHGDAQYRWLQATLAGSRAKWKFVFAHHVMGTGRGGIELARQYEWGGQNGKGVWTFPTERPTWARPIHQLLVDHGVTIFFQGHDHIWVRQAIDGVTYQTLSEPADPNYSLFNDVAYLSGDRRPNTGYTRVNVAPEGVKVEYVRTWLPQDERPDQVSGSVAFSYTLP